MGVLCDCFFFSSRRRHTRFDCDWSSDVCSSDLRRGAVPDRDRGVLSPARGLLMLRPKHPRESETVMSELMTPQHANIMGNVFGGVILAMADRVAAVAAIRHAGKQGGTVSVDKVDV